MHERWIAEHVSRFWCSYRRHRKAQEYAELEAAWSRRLKAAHHLGTVITFTTLEPRTIIIPARGRGFAVRASAVPGAVIVTSLRTGQDRFEQVPGGFDVSLWDVVDGVCEWDFGECDDLHPITVVLEPCYIGAYLRLAIFFDPTPDCLAPTDPYEPARGASTCFD